MVEETREFEIDNSVTVIVCVPRELDTSNLVCEKEEGNRNFFNSKIFAVSKNL